MFWIGCILLVLVCTAEMKPLTKDENENFMDKSKEEPKYWIKKGHIRVSKKQKFKGFKADNKVKLSEKITYDSIKQPNLQKLIPSRAVAKEVTCNHKPEMAELRALDGDRVAVHNTLTISEDITNSKLDKLLNMMTENWDTFKWEKSMLTEIAQTLSYLFSELRQQEKRVKRLNRNVKNSLRILFDGKDINEILNSNKSR